MFIPKGTVIADHWKQWIVENYGERGLSCGDFGNTVRLEFEDGSNALFKYAFTIENKEKDELAVFTEHCGYHFFCLSGIARKVETNYRE